MKKNPLFQAQGVALQCEVVEGLQISWVVLGTKAIQMRSVAKLILVNFGVPHMNIFVNHCSNTLGVLHT